MEDSSWKNRQARSKNIYKKFLCNFPYPPFSKICKKKKKEVLSCHDHTINGSLYVTDGGDNLSNRILSKVTEVKSIEPSLRISTPFPWYPNEKFLPRPLKSFSISRPIRLPGSSRVTACCLTTACPTGWLLAGFQSRLVQSPLRHPARNTTAAGATTGASVPFHVSLIISSFTVSVIPWRMQRGRNPAFFGAS